MSHGGGSKAVLDRMDLSPEHARRRTKNKETRSRARAALQMIVTSPARPSRQAHIAADFEVTVPDEGSQMEWGRELHEAADVQKCTQIEPDISARQSFQQHDGKVEIRWFRKSNDALS